MQFFTALEKRRSVKHFKHGETLDDTQFNVLMQAVLLSPTSYNIQNWRFIRIQDPELREALKAAAWGQAQVTDAAELIIFCANLNAWNEEPERYYKNTDSQVQATQVKMMYEFYQGRPQVQRDEAMRSCGIAAQTLMLSAKAMGYDTCSLGGFDREKVADLIKLPEHHVVTLMIALGTADKPAHPRAGQLSLDDVLFTNSF